MTTVRPPAELVQLRKAAQELSTQRKERFSTIHLLAVTARDGAPSAELFADRRVDEDTILKAARGISDEGTVAIGRAMTAAREMAKRAGTSDPGALHLVLALLADRTCAAHRALIELGVDVGRLRSAAMQVALGVVAARRAAPPLARRPALLPDMGPGNAGPAHLGSHGVSAAPTPTPRPSSHSTRPSSPPARPTVPGSLVPLLPPLVPRRPAPKVGPGNDVGGAAKGGGSRVVALPRRMPSIEGPGGGNLPARAPIVETNATAMRFLLDKERAPLLASLGKNLTELAASGALRPVIGRATEIESVLDILAKRHASSACVVGPAGVGKTAVVHGVAHRLVALAAKGEPARKVIEISVPQLVAGTGLRGALAEKVAALCAEAREGEGSILLFFDEIHELCGPAVEEATATLKLALARGEVQVIGATTPEEHRKSIEPDAALARRFTVVEVEEPAESEAVPLLRAVAEDLGAHHRASYDDDAIAASVGWCVRYLPGRALPDKAIHVLDLAGARVRRRAAGRAVPRVGLADVAGVVSELSDVPRDRLLETDGDRMLALERLIAERVVGHSAALERIARVLRRNAAGMRGRRPIGSFLLLGPTGVGKTETAKAIAESLFHSETAMTRLDLSEFAEPHALARLVGAPPGYVGHEAGGQLTEAVRRRPYQVVLLDEIEKAHRDVLLAFLQVLDEGHMTDGRGRKVDFTNTVIVLTSNLGSAEAGAAARERRVGFGQTDGAPRAQISKVMLAAARAALAPELYNRIDEVLCYEPLTRDEVAEIARRMLAELGRSLEKRGIRLDVEPAAVFALLDAGGFDLTLGARPIRRALARLVEAPLAEMILRGELSEGAVALIDAEDGAVVVDAIPARAAE
ncbi:MAG: ATP-dependent Clp protease ATP-binding subunit [Polyangiaceae bacterium]